MNNNKLNVNYKEKSMSTPVYAWWGGPLWAFPTINMAGKEQSVYRIYNNLHGFDYSRTV